MVGIIIQIRLFGFTSFPDNLNKYLLPCLFFFINVNVYGNDSILVDRVWTERQTVFVNEAQIDSIMDDSVTEYSGIGCGYGRCREIVFYTNHRFREIDVNGDTLLGKWKLGQELMTMRYDKKYSGRKKKQRYIIRYKEKDYPTLYLFSERIFDCYIFCNYKDL